MRQLGILVPSYNEEKNIDLVLTKLKKFNVYVVNDGSTDNTLDKLKKYRNIKIINKKKNSGYESAILSGLLKMMNNFNYILTIDSDGQHETKNIIKHLNFMMKNEIDLLIGNRSFFNRFEENILSFFFYIKFGIKDPISGYKFYKSDILKKLWKKIKNDKTFLISVVYFFHKKKCKIRNVDIKVSLNKKSKVGNTFKVKKKILSLIKYCFI